jgi:short subunit dehydrogenase-like uncharacterized protein
MSERELDIVLLGATGFVGALTAAHLAQHADPGVRVALAGRSLGRLEEVRAGLGEAAADWPLLQVDATDSPALRAMAARTRVLATTVGPYAVHGREVVRACAEEGTHYADLTGELLFVRWALDAVDRRAKETGARIVHACGFDSIPSDLGVLITAERAAADGAGDLTDVTLTVRSMRGGMSGGTIDSGRQQAIMARHDPSARATLADPYALSPRRDEEPTAVRTKSARRPSGIRRLARSLGVEQGADGRWTGPFVMAMFNTRIVRLSNTLSDWSYGRSLRYREVLDFGSRRSSPVKAVGTSLGLRGALVGLAYAPGRAVLDRVLPRPGEGPDAEDLARGRFRMVLDATTTSGARYRTAVGADLDPGYTGTAVMLGQSALCLAFDDLTERTGVLTPATALGDPLVDRLRAHGFTLECDVASD